jgi:histidinol phosphate phosphatase hisN-like protein
VRIAEIAGTGGRIAVAAASPASLLALFLEVVSLARAGGAEVPDLPDIGPVRADGRSGRSIRWVGGVATVTDGRSLCATRDGEAAREWLFVIPRPALVVAEPPFAEVAWEAGIEVVAVAGLDRAALAIAAVRGERCTLVPVRPDREPAAYETLVACIRQGATVQV